MEQLHFIINPIAGLGKHRLTHELLTSHFEKENYALQIKYSDYKKHASELTKESIAEGATIIVACGGDGTINEVASCLVDTPIALGIVPMGSGNGLASNLNIPNKIEKALSIIKQRQTTKIDVGSVNNHYFFSNTGVGFDASVIKNYEYSEKRTLSGYVRACLTSFKEAKEIKDFEIRINDTNLSVRPFMIFVSNSNEMGYKVSLTPKASLQDGLLDVMIISKIGRLKMLWLGILMLVKKSYWLKEAKSFQTENLELSCNTLEYFDSQIDGEFHKIKNSTISINIKNKALRVIVAKTHALAFN